MRGCGLVVSHRPAATLSECPYRPTDSALAAYVNKSSPFDEASRQARLRPPISPPGHAWSVVPIGDTPDPYIWPRDARHSRSSALSCACVRLKNRSPLLSARQRRRYERERAPGVCDSCLYQSVRRRIHLCDCRNILHARPPTHTNISVRSRTRDPNVCAQVTRKDTQILYCHRPVSSVAAASGTLKHTHAECRLWCEPSQDIVLPLSTGPRHYIRRSIVLVPIPPFTRSPSNGVLRRGTAPRCLQ